MTRGKKYGLILSIAAVLLLSFAAVALRGTSGKPPILPADAQAGAFSGFEPCSFDDADLLNTDKVECATLVVAENREKPLGRLLALPVIRLPAGGKDVREPIFLLNGGPGGSNLRFALETPLLHRHHDIVLVGYRGVDDAERLDCPEVSRAVRVTRPLSDSARQGISDAASRCARRWQERGVDLSRYTMFNVIADLEDARNALGYGRINLLSRSYGTRVAQYYSRIHPDNIKRSVLAVANPPGHFRWYPEVTNEILRRYAALCAQDAHCRSRTSDLEKTVLSVLDAPDRSWLGLAVDPDKLRLAAFSMMANRSSAVALFDALIAAEHGDTAGIYLATKIYDLVLPMAFVWGEMFSKGGGECDPSAEFVRLRQPSTTSLGSPLDLVLAAACRAWPVVPLEAPFDRVVRDETETLLISGNLDVSAPLVFAESELLPHLPNGQLVALKEFGHGEWAKLQPTAMDHLVTTFYRDGTVDASRYAYDPVPFEVDWGLPLIAKLLLSGALLLCVAASTGLGYAIRAIRRRKLEPAALRSPSL